MIFLIPSALSETISFTDLGIAKEFSSGRSVSTPIGTFYATSNDPLVITVNAYYKVGYSLTIYLNDAPVKSDNFRGSSTFSVILSGENVKSGKNTMYITGAPGDLFPFGSEYGNLIIYGTSNISSSGIFMPLPTPTPTPPPTPTPTPSPTLIPTPTPTVTPTPSSTPTPIPIPTISNPPAPPPNESNAKSSVIMVVFVIGSIIFALHRIVTHGGEQTKKPYVPYYYKVLGVSKNSSLDEIKNAYKKLIKIYHPDVSADKDTERKFREIQIAYETLSDPEKRSHYDKFENQDSKR